MTTQAKVGAFVLGCFSILAFTLIYLINAQFSGHAVPYRTYLRYAGGLEPGTMQGVYPLGRRFHRRRPRAWTRSPAKWRLLQITLTA